MTVRREVKNGKEGGMKSRKGESKYSRTIYDERRVEVKWSLSLTHRHTHTHTHAHTAHTHTHTHTHLSFCRVRMRGGAECPLRWLNS